jgi:hypothetical protein
MKTLTNASIIAAAPDMLEALEALVKESCRTMADLDPDLSGHQCLIAAFNAIAKAKGETPAPTPRFPDPTSTKPKTTK